MSYILWRHRTVVGASAALLWTICSLPAYAVPLQTLSNHVEDGAIVIGEGVVLDDAGNTSSFGDWSGVTAYQNNTNPNSLVESIAIANDSQYYYFKYTFREAYNIGGPVPSALNLYLDADSDPTTGQITWWGSDDLGADLLVQGSFVHDLSGGSPPVQLGTLDNPLFPFAPANGMEFRLSRDAVGDGDAFNFQLLEFDQGWAIADVYPYCSPADATPNDCDTTFDPSIGWPGIQPYFRYVADDQRNEVPEPGSLGLLGITLLAIGFSMARRKWSIRLNK